MRTNAAHSTGRRPATAANVQLSQTWLGGRAVQAQLPPPSGLPGQLTTDWPHGAHSLLTIRTRPTNERAPHRQLPSPAAQRASPSNGHPDDWIWCVQLLFLVIGLIAVSATVCLPRTCWRSDRTSYSLPSYRETTVVLFVINAFAVKCADETHLQWLHGQAHDRVSCVLFLLYMKLYSHRSATNNRHIIEHRKKYTQKIWL